MAFVGNAIADAFVRVRPDTKTFKAEASLGIRSALGSISPGVGRVLSLGRLGPIAGTVAVVGAAVGAAALEAGKLEEALNVLQATAELTDAQLAQASERAQELGADLQLPGVSATDAANALLELSKAGLDFQQAMDGTKGVLQLAAASGLTFADSAEFVGNALNAFQLPGQDAIAVVDALANASKLAQGDIQDFGLGMQQSAAVANLAGVSMNELTGLLTLLAKAGISGSDAGTSIRTTLLRLIPTSKEAADTVKALGISLTDQAGNIRPLSNIFEQYRQALAELEPATRQAALTTIFGTDAIRAASIFARAGGKGIDAMTEATKEQGTAAEIAAAKNKGLLGSFRNLSSQVQTLATTIGAVATPAITGFVNEIAGAVGDLNDIAKALKKIDFGGAIDDIPGGKKGSNILVRVWKDGTRLLPVIGTIRNTATAIKFLRDQLVDEPLVTPLPVKFGLEGFTDSVSQGKKIIKKSAEALAKEARLQADRVTKENAIAASKLAIQNAQAAVTAAKLSLAETIKAGNEAIAAASLGAKQNLVSIATNLSQQAVELIDQGPLGRRIRELQALLDTSKRGGEKRRLKSQLDEAQRALDEARESAATAGTATPAQRQAMAEFLRPFEDGVADAEQALRDFTTEGVITRLQKAAEAQKTAVTKGIADVVAEFNTGRINAAEANRRIAATLGKAIPNYKTSGAKLGAAFNAGFIATIQGLQQQIAEIVAGPQTTKTGFEPDVISPTEAAAKAAGATAAARLTLADAQRSLVQTSKEQLAEQKATNSLLNDIKAQQRAAAGKKAVPKTTGVDFMARQPGNIHDRPLLNPAAGSTGIVSFTAP